MALTLDQIRAFVRGHIDIEEEDLPNDVLDVFIREGSKRIERAEKRWPFYAKRWTYTTVSGQSSVEFAAIDDGDIREISAIKGPQWRLTHIGQDLADEVWPESTTQTGEPTHYSIENEVLYFWPEPGDSYELTIRGYRTAVDWVAQGAGAEPDLPDELHNTVATWALARAYAQQDDPEMAALYERQFADEVTLYRNRLHDAPAPQPVVLNGGSRRSTQGRLRYDWEF
jgi:hypothetical protein